LNCSHGSLSIPRSASENQASRATESGCRSSWAISPKAGRPKMSSLSSQVSRLTTFGRALPTAPTWPTYGSSTSTTLRETQARREPWPICARSMPSLWTRHLQHSPSEHGRRSGHDGQRSVPLRLPRNAGPSDIRDALKSFLDGLQHHDISGQLWVVRPDRIRIWKAPDAAG
jgi:hypothetical protein